MVDYVGEASRVAQNLHRPVTIAHSFVNSNQTLYIMTDASANKYTSINQQSDPNLYEMNHILHILLQRQWSYFGHA